MVVNTSRMMNDGHKDNSVGERKLIWDENNHYPHTPKRKK